MAFFVSDIVLLCLYNTSEVDADVLQNRCSQKFCNIHRKSSLSGSLFNKVAGLKACNFY